MTGGPPAQSSAPLPDQDVVATGPAGGSLVALGALALVQVSLQLVFIIGAFVSRLLF